MIEIGRLINIVTEKPEENYPLAKKTPLLSLLVRKICWSKYKKMGQIRSNQFHSE